MATFVETFHVHWSKALSLVLLNLRSIPFGMHKLSPFEIVTGHPMHLVPAPWSTADKGDIFQYSEGLIACNKITMFCCNNLYTGHSFSPSATHSTAWRFYLLKKTTLERLTSTSLKDLYQALLTTLCQQTPGNRYLDSGDMYKRALLPGFVHHLATRKWRFPEIDGIWWDSFQELFRPHKIHRSFHLSNELTLDSYQISKFLNSPYKLYCW